MSREPLPPNAIIREALALADSAARSDIEVFCETFDIDGNNWYRLKSKCSVDAATNFRNAAYLKARKKINFHATRTEFVNFTNIPE